VQIPEEDAQLIEGTLPGHPATDWVSLTPRDQTSGAALRTRYRIR
jgi:hypothetical protein